jgi:TolA-binding protein
VCIFPSSEQIHGPETHTSLKKYAILLLLILTGLQLPLDIHAQGIPVPSRSDYLQGMRLYDEGLFEPASAKFRNYLAYATDEPYVETAWFYLAKANIATDSTRRVLYSEEFVARYPATSRAATLLIDLGHHFRMQQEYILAIDYFERALEITPDVDPGAQTMFWTAEMYIALGDYDTARAYYLRLADTWRRSELAPAALYARGRLYLEQLQFAETSVAFELLRERYPFHAMTRRIGTALGESYFQQGMYREAITALRGALPTLDDPEQESKAVYLVAESYNFLDELEDASTWYLRFVNQNRGNENERLAHYGLGWVYHKQAIYHWSAQSFGRAMGGDDEFARKALYYKAINEKLSGRYDLALQSFQEFGRRYREGPWVEKAYFEWAVVSFEIGDYSSAISTLLDLVRSSTRLQEAAQVYTLLGEAFFANNEFGPAVDAFEVAEQLTEVDPAIKRQARFQRGWVLFQNQAWRAAQPIFEQVYSEDPRGRLAGEALFWSADSWYNLEEYARAAEQFDKFLRDFPGHEFSGAALYSQGWAYFRMGQYENAIPPLRSFLDDYKAPPIALFPYDIDTKLRLGDSYYAMRQYREALRFYEQAVGTNPGADYALYQVANSYYRLEQTFEAVQAFRRLLRQFPESRLREQAMYNVGYIYFLAGNYSQAIEEFDRVIRQYRGSNWAARAQYNIGDAWFNAGEYDKAIEAYQLVLNNYPRSPLIVEAVNGIQYATLASGRSDNSSDILEAFIRDNPQAGTADQLRFRQAELLLRTADYVAAVEAFRDYIRVTNSRQMLPEAWFNLAEAYRQMGNEPASIEAFTTILSEYPRSGRAESALLNLGMMAFSSNRYDDALRFFTQLRDRTTRLRNEAGVGVGNSLLALGRLNEAADAYAVVLRNNAGNDTAELGLAKVNIRRGEFSDARTRLVAISERNVLEPGAEAMYWLGFVHQQEQLFDEAMETYSRVRVLFEAYEDWASMALVRIAEIHRSRGNISESRATYQRVVESYPGTEAAGIAKRVLEGN